MVLLLLLCVWDERAEAREAPAPNSSPAGIAARQLRRNTRGTVPSHPISSYWLALPSSVPAMAGCFLNALPPLCGQAFFGGALRLSLPLFLTWSNHVRTRLCHFLWKWPFGKTLLCFTILPQRHCSQTQGTEKLSSQPLGRGGFPDLSKRHTHLHQV